MNSSKSTETRTVWNPPPDSSTLPLKLCPCSQLFQELAELVRSFARLPSVSGLLLPAILAAALAGTVRPLPVRAQGGEDPSPHSEADLISEVTSVRPGTPFTVAVRFELDPGWHNYWRNPGDSGLPTTIAWTLPPGFEAGEIQWPPPHPIVAFPLVDYGYSGEVVLLVDLTPPDDLAPGEVVRLEARVDWLICERICLPAYGELSLELPVQAATPEPDPYWVSLFAQARDRLPRRVEGWTFEAEVTDDGYRLSVEPDGPGLTIPDSVYFFPAETSILDHAAPQVATREGGGLTLGLTASPYAMQPSPVLRGVLTAEGGGSWDREGNVRAMEVSVPVAGAPPLEAAGPDAAGPTAPPAEGPASAESPGGARARARTATAAAGLSLVLAVLFAFLGGILLNLMPCVFPILSLKILGAASHGGGDRARIRNQGLMFGLGVILTFLALGGLLVALRAGGAQLGWGFQLQSPIFVAFMAALFFAVGLNLMGLFEVGALLTRLGSRPGEPSGYGEALASGVLATVIATPCTAPFMGAALGFALTRATSETLLIFGFLGLGMALPYVILSVAPGLLERLPRPGRWMETLRNILAFPLFATVIWLVWVFGQQTGMGGAAYLLSALLLVSAAGWMVGRWHRTDLRSGVVARVISVAVLVLAALLVVRASRAQGPMEAVAEGWLPFTQEEVDRTLAEGRPVFVDFTAAWCLTCQVNERVVLSTDAIQRAFQDRNVALFKADWTRQDPEITAALEALDRSGVPVYVLYAGGAGSEPYLLPALLTEGIVLEALATVLPRDGSQVTSSYGTASEEPASGSSFPDHPIERKGLP